MEIIKKTLTLKEAIDFKTEVVRDYFDYDDNEEIISYTPYLGLLKMKINFLKYYTDYEFSDPEKDYRFVLGFNPERHFGKIDCFQYSEIRDSIKDEVEVLKQIYINSQNGIAKFMNTLTSMFKEVNIDAMNNLMNKYNDSDFSAQSLVDAYLKSEGHKTSEEV